MPLRSFDHNEMLLVSEALDIAEDATGDFFKYSLAQWKRCLYEVKTLNALTKDEIRPFGFAFLRKYKALGDENTPPTRSKDLYAICLQDHMILNALKRDQELRLLSLLVYVFTHELVHIVRFCNFIKGFDVSEKAKVKEEKAVHAATYKILKDVSMPHLGYILESYKAHRLADMTGI